MNLNGNGMSEDIISLLSAYTDGSLAKGEVEKLRALLAEDPEALKLYIEWMRVHALLALDFQNVSHISTPPISAGRFSVQTPEYLGFFGGRRRWIRAAISVAAAASFVFAIAQISRHRSSEQLAEKDNVIQSKAQYTSELEESDEFHRIDANSVAVLANV